MIRARRVARSKINDQFQGLIVLLAGEASSSAARKGEPLLEEDFCIQVSQCPEKATTAPAACCVR